MTRSLFGEAIQAAIDSKPYEVTFKVTVSARNIGEAVRRASDRLSDSAVTVSDVREIKSDS